MAEQKPVEIVLGADATQMSAAVAKVTAAINASERAAAAEKRQVELSGRLQRSLSDAQVRLANATRKRVSDEERIIQLKQRQLLIEQKLGGQITANQRTALQLAQARAQMEMHGLQGGGGGLLRNLMTSAGFGHWVGRYDQVQGVLGQLGAAGVSRSMLMRGAIGIGAPIAAGVGIGYAGIRAGADLENRSVAIRAMARRMGISTDDAQAMLYAGGASGVGNDRLSDMMGDLLEAKGQAGLGNEGTLKAFGAFGISAADARAKSVTELLRQMVAAMKDGRLTAEQYANGVQLLGRQFKEVGPEIERVVQKMGEFSSGGLGVSGQVIENANTGSRIWGGMKARIGARLGQAKSWLGEGALRVRDKLMFSTLGWAMSQEDRDALLASIGSRGFGAEYDVSGSGVAAMQAKLDAKLASRETDRSFKDAWRENEEEWARWEQEGLLDAEMPSAGGRRRRSTQAQADALARIGLFVGGGSNQSRIMREQITNLRQIVAELRALNRKADAEADL